MGLAEQLLILKTAKGMPAQLALATVDLAHDTRPEAERLRIKDALLAAAVPHWCDSEFLAALLQATPKQAVRLFGKLRTLTVIEPFPARGKHAINVHETSRLALREHLRKTKAPLWEALSARARAHAAKSRKPHARIEALYHLFATDQAAAAKECEALDREFTLAGRHEVASALALSLRELTDAGWLTGAAQVEALLSQLEVRNRRGETAQLETEARKALKIARKTSVPSGIGRALSLLGDVLRTKGRLDGALDAFLEYLAIFERLVATDRSNIYWQRELAIAHSKIGDIYQKQGRPDDALAAFHKDLAITQRLTKIAPSTAGWQRELAVAHCEIGGIHHEQGRLDDAVAAFRKDLAISRRLAKSAPSHTGWQQDLAITHSRMGSVRQEQGRLDAALASFRENLAIFKRLAAKDPSNAGWQQDLAIAHSKMGGIRQQQGRLDDALDFFRESLAIFQRLAATSPLNAGWQRELAAAENRLGQVFREMGNEQQARSSFRSAVKTMTRAAKMSPGNTDWKIEVRNMKSWLRLAR